MEPSGPDKKSGLPAKLGNYRIEGRLGAGGMGVVYRAFDEVLERHLAIKHLPAQKAGPTAARRFLREARAAARLNHPAIVHIYDIVESEQGNWIVMELVEGRTLDLLIQEGSLGVAQTVRLSREIAEGLAEAHAQGIIHRDLKSTNIMVTPAGRAKVLDFGLAKFLSQEDEGLSQTGIVLGTYHAMSPEQIRGQELDPRSDLFSFGTLLYEMLAGVSPFRTSSIPETLTRICRSPHVPVCDLRPDVPRRLSELVDELLQKEADRRPQSAAEVARFLADFERSGLAFSTAPGTGTPSPFADSEARTAASPEWALDLGTGPTLVDGIFARRPPAVSAPAEPSTPSSTRPTSERRQMTVACCELVGRDAAGAPKPFDAETLHDLMGRLRGLAETVAARHAGHLGSVLGHRLLLYFGYPHAYEDNARRAVQAALDLIDQAGERLDTGLGRAAARPAVRVGVHTGPAIVSSGLAGTEPVTLGATLDAAVELAAQAGPDEVVASPATSALVHRGFVLEPLPPVRLAGMEAAAPPHRVLAGHDALDDTLAGLAPLVGRQSELELLLGRWVLAREGTGQVVLISGDAGIGKSRLVSALRERLESRPQDAARWLSTYGSLATQHSPLQPVASLLRRVFGLAGGEPAWAAVERTAGDFGLAEAVPLFGALLDLPADDLHPAPGLAPDRQREKTLEALAALVLEMAERQPLVLVIEDLHWLDPTTLEWLDRLIDQVSAVPLFLVMTLRLQAMESLWGPRAHLTQVTLAPLSAAESEKLIDQVARRHGLPEAVRQEIVDRTDGVPLFVEELTKAALESHQSGEGPDLPATLRDSLAARLDRLGAAKEVAQLASVIGRVFSLDLLAAVAPHDEATLQHELRRLVQAELIHRRGAGRQTRYLFKHALVQDAAYDSLLKRERQQIHRRIAEALEARFPEILDSQPELLAHHFEQAGESDVAAQYWFRAGGLALRRSASREALHHLEAALRLIETLPEDAARDRRELDIQNALAAATITGRGYFDPGVEKAFARAEILAERLNATEERFWALLGLHTYQYVVGNYPKTLELSERLVSLAESAGSPNLRAIAWLSFAIYHIWQCDHRTALEELARAYEIAPPDDDSYRNRMGSDLRVTTLAFGTIVRWHLGLLDQARRQGEQAIALAVEIGHPFTLALARLFGGAGLAHYLRDVEATLSKGQELYDVAVELGFHVWSLQAAFLIAWARSRSGPDPGGREAPSIGDFETAQRTIQQSAGGAMPYYFGIHAEILAGQGRLDDALRALEEGLAICEERKILPWTEEMYRLRGEILLQQGGADPAEVESLFRTAFWRAQENRSKVLELRAALSLGRLWQGQGKVDEARNLVAGAYGGFGEGLDTFDLREAAEFLSALPAAAD